MITIMVLLRAVDLCSGRMLLLGVVFVYLNAASLILVLQLLVSYVVTFLILFTAPFSNQSGSVVSHS